MHVMTSTVDAAASPAVVSLDLTTGDDARQVIESLAGLLGSAGRVTDVGSFVESVMQREALGSTALPGGIAIPHARSAAVAAPSVAVARLAAPVSFAEGKPAVDVVLLIAAPDEDPDLYLRLLSKLAGACVQSSFRTSLRTATTPTEVAAVVARAVGRP